MKMAKTAGVDNISTELVQTGGGAIIEILAQFATKHGRQEIGHLHGFIPLSVHSPSKETCNHAKTIEPSALYAILVKLYWISS